MAEDENGPSEPHCVDFGRAREHMVETQLRTRGIADSHILAAMAAVPREEFVPAGLRFSAYDDTPLAIGCGQTISQPFTVAYMCQALQLRGDEKVLEVGTGSGYGAAILSRVARTVHTVERIPTLAYQADDRLRRLGFENVFVHVANGSLGLPAASPFDAILVTAGAKGLPRVYLDQLGKSGRVVIPLGRSAPTCQTLYRFVLEQGTIVVEDLGGFAFVPLIGTYGWELLDDESRLEEGTFIVRR